MGLTSGRTCTPTPSCPEAPPCTPVLLTVCRRRSPPLLPLPSRSRSSLPPRGSTPSGSEDPSWPPSPPSSRCGSPGVRRERPRHCPPQVLLNVLSNLLFLYVCIKSDDIFHSILNSNSKKIQIAKKKKK